MLNLCDCVLLTADQNRIVTSQTDWHLHIHRTTRTSITAQLNDRGIGVRLPAQFGIFLFSTEPTAGIKCPERQASHSRLPRLKVKESVEAFFHARTFHYGGVIN